MSWNEGTKRPKRKPRRNRKTKDKKIKHEPENKGIQRIFFSDNFPKSTPYTPTKPYTQTSDYNSIVNLDVVESDKHFDLSHLPDQITINRHDYSEYPTTNEYMDDSEYLDELELEHKEEFDDFIDMDDDAYYSSVGWNEPEYLDQSGYLTVEEINSIDWGDVSDWQRPEPEEELKRSEETEETDTNNTFYPMYYHE